MSRAQGWLYEDDHGGDPLGYCVYDGTVDIMHAKYDEDADAAWDWFKRWRDGAAEYPECNCGKRDSPCLLRSDYGSGKFWASRFCRRCKVITGQRSPYDEW